MATLTLNATRNANNSVSVTVGTGGSLTGQAALLIDNTIADKQTMQSIIEGLERALSVLALSGATPGQLPTSGTIVV